MGAVCDSSANAEVVLAAMATTIVSATSAVARRVMSNVWLNIVMPFQSGVTRHLP